mgnify:CR=1 FL=1
MNKPLSVKKVGHWGDFSYWLCDDGNVWGSSGYHLTANNGPLEEFITRFKAGKYRGTLTPEFETYEPNSEKE